MMFLLAVFYDLEGPDDDGSCKKESVGLSASKVSFRLGHTVSGPT